MNVRDTLLRLLWRNAREDWLPIVLLLIGPPFLMRVAQTAADTSVVKIFPYVLFAVVFGFWAMGKAVRSSSTSEFARSHLPVGRVTQWVTAYLAPLLAALLIGVWQAFWLVSIWNVRQWFADYALQFATIAVCAFLIAQMLTLSVSRWLGLLASAVFAFATLFGSSTLLFQGYLGSHLGIMLDSSLIHYLWWSAACLLGLVLYHGSSGLFKERTRQVAALVLALMVVFGYEYWDYARGERPLTIAGARLDSPDWAQYARVVTYRDGRTFIEYRNLRLDHRVRRRIEGTVLPVAFGPGERVYLVQQMPGRNSVRLLDWQPTSGRARLLVEVPSRGGLGRNTYWKLPGARAFLSPDRPLLLLALRSPLGESNDLWQVDLATHKASLLLADSMFGTTRASWKGHYALLSGTRDCFAPALLVDLQHKRTQWANEELVEKLQ